MGILRSIWMLVGASVFFLVGSLSLLDDDRYRFGAWMFVIGSSGFLLHSAAEAVARRSGADRDESL